MRNRSMPAGPGLTEAVEPRRAAWLLNEPGVAANLGFGGSGPAQLLHFWIGQCPPQEWRSGGHPVVFTTMRKAAAQLGVSAGTARRYAHLLRHVGAWTPAQAPGGRPKQGVDLSPLAEFIPRLTTIYERLTTLHRKRQELSIRQLNAARAADAHIRQMLKTGLLSHDELYRDRLSSGEYLVPDPYHPQGWGYIEAIERETREQKRCLARIEAVAAKLQRIEEEPAPQTLFPTTNSRDRTATADAGAPSRNASRKERSND